MSTLCNKGTFCMFQCLLSEYVFDLLNVPQADGLNEANFGKASTLIIYFMYQLPKLCITSDTIDWKEMDYQDIVRKYRLQPPIKLTTFKSQPSFFEVKHVIIRTYLPN